MTDKHHLLSLVPDPSRSQWCLVSEFCAARLQGLPKSTVASFQLLRCPLTTKHKGYPFAVPIDDARGSAVLADQVKSLDWRARRAKAKGRISDAELSAVRMKAKALIG